MIRFIIRRKINDAESRATEHTYETIDGECPALEAALSGSRYGPKGYDLREMVGVELLPTPDFHAAGAS